MPRTREVMKIRNIRMLDRLWADLNDLAYLEDLKLGGYIRDILSDHVRRNRRRIDAFRAAHPEQAWTPADSTRPTPGTSDDDG